MVALCAGGLLLFRTPGSVIGVSPFVVLTIAVLFGVGLATVATKVVAARHTSGNRDRPGGHAGP